MKRLRLGARTGLAAFAATALALLVLGVALRGQFQRVLRERVDRQLVERAETAPVLAAVAERLATSELRATLEGARVVVDDETVSIGLLPDQALPAVERPGWSTARADGEHWRLYTVVVADVPDLGDQTLVQLVAPLGDVDAQARTLRRGAIGVTAVTALAAGALGLVLGGAASRPLTNLRRDTAELAGAAPSRRRVADRYGSPEVDEVATTLNVTLDQLAAETERREATLEAARVFAAGAAHELRTPLQSALTNLDMATSDRVDAALRDELVANSHRQLQRMAAVLTAVGALADAELADPAWFADVDLADIVDAVVVDEARRARDVTIDVVGDARSQQRAWADGVRLAVENLVRNAVHHGHRTDGRPGRVTVRIAGRRITVDDDGPGIPVADRDRVLRRFERGAGDGSGLGLALVHQVAVVHGGSVVVGERPGGGARIELDLGPPPAAARPDGGSVRG